MAINKKNEPPRKPTPKIGKITNTASRQKYKRNNPHCEVCLLEGIIHPATELHHIIPGLGRTDEEWNHINLCQSRHQEATQHVHGRSAQLFNVLLFGIKLLKKEITYKKLQELNLLEEVKLAAEKIKPLWEAWEKGEIKNGTN
jgi:hypothetical protein